MIVSLRSAWNRCQAKFFTTATAPSGGNVMNQVIDQAVHTANVDGRRELFARTNPNGIKPGSVVLVETVTTPKETSTSNFMGVCIAIRRKGIDTSFTLRNIVMRVGVEQRFSLYSPLVKSVRVLQQPTEKFRRAKLFYLRESPGRVFQPLQNLWKQEQLDKKA